MTPPPAPPRRPQPFSGQHYVVISLAALAVLLLVLLQWRLAEWSFLPVLLGMAGVVLRLRSTPFFTLILLSGLLLAGELTDQPALIYYQPRGFNLAEWLLCGALLAFFAAQYRLQEILEPTLSAPLHPARAPLWRRLFGRRTPAPPPSPPRTAWRPVPAGEVPGVLVVVLIWAFLAQVVWRLLPSGGEAFALSTWTWRGVLLAWFLIVGTLATAGLLDYAGQRQRRSMEAQLFLQEALWQETRGEQRLVASALARAQRARRPRRLFSWLYHRRRKDRS